MNVKKLLELMGSEFYVGVPDSQLKALCDCLIHTYGMDPRHHIVAANEGNCAGIATGYYLATGRVPVVYMQNSGEGNIINPIASLLNEKVYAIPMILIIGWRGEPGVHDEPQHIFQGEVTLRLLEDMGIAYFVISKDTAVSEIIEKLDEFRLLLDSGKQVAFVVRKSALEFDDKVIYANEYKLTREEVIRHIAAVTGAEPIVSTTGKASRELFEIREANGQGHGYDFLTVGSMGHSSSIALGIALQKPEKKVWVVDGDGAVLMHMGAMAVIGASGPKNLVHIVINNRAHESVGGMPTGAEKINLVQIAKGCGYTQAVCVNDFQELDKALLKAKAEEKLSLIEVRCAIGSRSDLGRPTMSPLENKMSFMSTLAQ